MKWRQSTFWTAFTSSLWQPPHLVFYHLIPFNTAIFSSKISFISNFEFLKTPWSLSQSFAFPDLVSIGLFFSLGSTHESKELCFNSFERKFLQRRAQTSWKCFVAKLAQGGSCLRWDLPLARKSLQFLLNLGSYDVHCSSWRGYDTL